MVNITFKINNKLYFAEANNTVIQACSNVGIDIPRFCYHEKLSIAGNCRMCLVEISFPKSIKPVASCALPVVNNMSLHTNTIMVKKARESVLEFLLINHPLDCPICDQGGECDLQDQTIVFGNDRGRFYDNKRAVSDKECGPLIKTIMTRCIHCTRCVRFGDEIAGVYFLGTTGRGFDTEISTYIANLAFSELSGNIIDLCPVGALTSKSYAYMARSWELKSTETIDILDSLGSNIKVDHRGLEILRILPRLNELINGEWITDKIRFCYDAFSINRLQYPLIRFNKKYIAVSWEAAFLWIGLQITHRLINKFVGWIGGLSDLGTIYILKKFLSKLGNNLFLLEDVNKLLVDFRENFLLNISLQNIFQIDLCILYGFNPRMELPLLNTRLKHAVKNKNCLVFSIGYMGNLTYNSKQLSNSIINLLKIIEGKSFLCRKFIRATKPVILAGNSILKRGDSLAVASLIPCILHKVFNFFYKSFFFNIIITSSGAVNACEIGAFNNNLGIEILNFKNFFNNSFVYVLGGTDLSFFSSSLFKNIKSFKIFQGHTGSSIINMSDVILPSTTFIEANSFYMNLEGRVQHSKFIKLPYGLARVDWKIIASLSKFLGYDLGIKTSSDVYKNLQNVSGFFNNSNSCIFFTFLKSSKNISTIFKLKLHNHPFLSLFFDYYLTNCLTKSSKFLLRASKRFIQNKNFIDV